MIKTNLQQWEAAVTVAAKLIAAIGTLVGAIGKLLKYLDERKRSKGKAVKPRSRLVVVIIEKSGQFIVFGVVLLASAAGYLPPSVPSLLLLAFIVWALTTLTRTLP